MDMRGLHPSIESPREVGRGSGKSALVLWTNTTIGRDQATRCVGLHGVERLRLPGHAIAGNGSHL
jgi:hypothetical protein